MLTILLVSLVNYKEINIHQDINTKEITYQIFARPKEEIAGFYLKYRLLLQLLVI